MNYESLVKDVQLKQARGQLSANIGAEDIAESMVKLKLAEGFYSGFYNAFETDEFSKEKEKIANQADDLKMQKGNAGYARLYSSEIASSGDLLKEHINDIGLLASTHVRGDFPLALRRCRKLRIEDPKRACPSEWRRYTRVRTADICGKVFALEVKDVGDLLPIKEGEDVTYTTFNEELRSEYCIEAFARALSYSWQLSECDDIGMLAAALNELGRKAAELPFKKIAQTIAANIPRTLLPLTGAGGISEDRLKEIIKLNACNDESCCVLDTLLYGVGEQVNVYDLTSGGEDNQSALVRGFNRILEPQLNQYLGGDWLFFAGNNPFVELGLHRLFRAGPRFITGTTDASPANFGSFTKGTFDIKIMYVLGAGIIDNDCIFRVEGCDPCAV